MTAIRVVEGIGALVVGEPMERMAEVWLDGRIVDMTRLAHGASVVPGQGHFQLKQRGNLLAEAQVDLSLLAEPTGPFELAAKKGTMHVWPMDAGGAASFLAGGDPVAKAAGRLDLQRLDIPHAVLRLGVQVQDGQRVGPLRVFEYTPPPRPVDVSIDHDHGTTGPRTHLHIDTHGLQAVAIEAHRHVRQTDASTEARYAVQEGEDRITFDDLLHGDHLTLKVAAPHALVGREGGPVAMRHFTYRAVPEPRLQPTDEAEPEVQFKAGIRHLPDAAVDVFQTVSNADLSVPGWTQQWPVTTAGQDVTSLVDALVDHLGDVTPGDLHTDPQRLAWWLGVVEAGQDVQAADTLTRRLRIRTPATDVDAAAAAVHALDGLPLDLLADLDVDANVTAAVGTFQQRLGVKDQDAAAVIQLARTVRVATEQAIANWADELEAAGLGWVDGALAPLDDDITAGDLRRAMTTSPQEAVQALRDRRERIFRVARVAAVDATQAHDVEARRVLLRWHLDQGRDAMMRLVQGLTAAGVEAPQVDASNLEGFAKSATALARAVEVAGARLAPVPLKGPAFVEAAAAEGATRAKELRAVLGVWTHDRVPPALRTPLARLVEPLDDATMSRLAIWARFMDQSAAWIRDMGTMAAAGGDLGARADTVRRAFKEASERRDAVRFAEAAGDFRRLESAIHNARDAWNEAIRNAAAPTRRALGLAQDQDTSWEAIRRRMTLDAAEIRALARLVLDVGPEDVRLATAVRPRGDLDQVLQAAEQAGPDPQRAAAVADYDKVRRRIAGWFDGDDAVPALRAAYVTGVIEQVRERLRRSMGRADPARIAVLQAFPDVPGARELGVLAAFLEQVGRLDPQSADTVDEVGRIAGVVRRLDGADADPWTAVADQLRTRLRDAYPDLVKYLQDKAPRWSDLETPEKATKWLVAMCTALRNPGDHPDIAALKPGTRRLVQHTLQERGLWFPG